MLSKTGEPQISAQLVERGAVQPGSAVPVENVTGLFDLAFQDCDFGSR
jgi:hypothetical protein